MTVVESQEVIKMWSVRER